MTVDDPNDPMCGVVQLGDGLTPVDIWQGLHGNARAWQNVPYGAGQQQDRMLIDGTDLSVLRALAEYPAEDWAALCHATGWTVYGAVGLSWCADADLKLVWDAWRASRFVIKPLPDFERPARLINPALMPETRKLSELIELSTPSGLALCAMIAASGQPLEIDLPVSKMKNATAQIASFLKSRLLQRGQLNADDRMAMAAFDHTIAGSDFDIWGLRQTTDLKPVATMA